jgi:hypothetical protein
MVKPYVPVHYFVFAPALRVVTRAAWGSMSERLPFDLHLAESTAQAAAIWFVLDALLERHLSTTSPMERTRFRAALAAEAVTLALPEGVDPSDNAAMDWVAKRYWELIDNFIARNAAADA